LSALAGLFGSRGSGGEEAIRSMLERMPWRGAEGVQIWEGRGAGVGCARHAWEFGADFAGRVGLLVSDDLVVAADATLYYLHDLWGALDQPEHRSRPTNPSEWVALAYRAWGPGLASHLEGDFAFLVWDRHAQRLVASRDFAGFRPLYYADDGTSLFIASTVAGIIGCSGVSKDLDLPVLAGLAGGLHGGSGPQTCYSAIRAVPAGHTLVWTPERGGRLTPHWSPPRWPDRPDLSFEEATGALRDLLRDAVDQRLVGSGVTTVSLSGGWDSTAVFAIAQDLLRDTPSNRSVKPISMSYPEGDPGREDELIERTTGAWDVAPHWLDAYDVEVLGRLESGAHRRDQPFTHLYETWNRALARPAPALGSHVQLSGYGGDQLFQVSEVYLADLLRRGRLGQLRKEAGAKGVTGLRPLVRWAVLPNLPRWLVHLLGNLRGQPLREFVERWIPTWFSPDFVRRSRLAERENPYLISAQPGSRAEAEWRWYILHPFFPLVSSVVAELALEEGVEVRAPLYDRRIVEFTSRRPWSDRSRGNETKRLLRAAIEGLVPDEVIAPRTHRTGVTSGLARRAFEGEFPTILRRMLDRPLRLAKMGIVEEDQFRLACRSILEGKPESEEEVIGAFYTVQAELWIRAHVPDPHRSERTGAAETSIGER
jgi:asparagine synthase (glutamine-hydrolysing)